MKLPNGKYERLFKFILFGKRHLDHVVSEFSDDYVNRGSRPIAPVEAKQWVTWHLQSRLRS